MSINNRNDKEFEEVIRLFERRRKIMIHNNNCILETVIFYENFFLSHIIKPLFFSENYASYEKMNDFIKNRMNFMDRYKVVLEIARKKGINGIKEFDKFIEMRNNLAHNLSNIASYNRITEESEILFGGKQITWDAYLVKINKWANLSYDMAKFTKDVYKSNNKIDNMIMMFNYCTVEGKCILIQRNVILPEPEGEYTSFVHSGIDTDLLQYINEENSIKGSEINE